MMSLVTKRVMAEEIKGKSVDKIECIAKGR
jgi:hypothetical protein